MIVNRYIQLYRSVPKTFYVYLICVNDGPVKIGSTSRLRHRVKNLRAGIWLPFHTKLIRCADNKESLALERHLQKSLVSTNIRGEWFDCGLDQIERLLTGPFGHLTIRDEEAPDLTPVVVEQEPSFSVSLA